MLRLRVETLAGTSQGNGKSKGRNVVGVVKWSEDAIKEGWVRFFSPEFYELPLLCFARRR